MNIALPDIIIVILYMALMLGFILYYVRRKVQNMDDYYLGGRQFSVPILVGTIVSTYFGVDSLAGNSEMGFSMGISGFFSYCIAAWLLIIFLSLIGGNIKKKAGDAYSPMDIIYRTYGSPARYCSALGSIVYSIPIVEMMGLGLVFRIVFGLEYWQGVLIAAVISVIFTYFGGMIAVALTDMVNLAIISIGLALVGIIGWAKIGPDNVWEGLTNFVGGDPSFYFEPSGGWITAGIFITYSASALSVACEPTLFQRILAAKDSGAAQKAFFLGSFIYLAYALITVVIGILTAASVGLGTIPELEPSEALISFALNYLPAGVFGIFLAGYFAAGVSSLDSYFLVAGNNMANDLVAPIRKKKISETQKLKWTKTGVLVACALSVIMSFYFGRIMGAWVFLSGVLVNTTIVPLYTALYLPGKKYPLAGNVSTIVGLVGTIVYYLAVDRIGYYDESWGTRMLDISIFGNDITLWQEYNIIILLPLVAILYFIIHFICRAMDKGGRVNV